MLTSRTATVAPHSYPQLVCLVCCSLESTIVKMCSCVVNWLGKSWSTRAMQPVGHMCRWQDSGLFITVFGAYSVCQEPFTILSMLIRFLHRIHSLRVQYLPSIHYTANFVHSLRKKSAADGLQTLQFSEVYHCQSKRPKPLILPICEISKIQDMNIFTILSYGDHQVGELSKNLGIKKS